MFWLRRITTLCAVLLLTACSSTHFVNVWQNDQVIYRHALNHLLILRVDGSEGVRRNFEDILTASLFKAGLRTDPSYRIDPYFFSDKALTGKFDLQTLRILAGKAHADSVLVVYATDNKRRQIVINREPTITLDHHISLTDSFSASYHAPLYGGSESVEVNDVIPLEMNLWHLPDGELLWSGTFYLSDGNEQPTKIAKDFIKALKKAKLLQSK